MPVLDLNQNYQIACSQGHPTALLAVRELQSVMSAICGRTFPVTAQPVGNQPAFSLVCQEREGEGFEWHLSGADVILKGAGPRGLLYAVYSFLEALGCCWYAPGEEGALIPRGDAFDLPGGVQQEAPALPGRCLIIGHQAFMQDAADWIEWAARNRLNTIFFHTTEGALALGAVHESQYQALKPVFLPLIQEREMTLEHGGHGLAGLLPRSLFEEIPDAFRMKDGRRRPDHNFCISNQRGMEIIRRNAADHFRRHPEVNVFHIWADDIEGGGWCECPACREYTASEQLLLATNAIADVLAETLPAAQISYIAYHDTEEVPARVAPRPNVHLLWAPRMRCYAHGTTDPGCQRNVPHYEKTLRGQAAHFKMHGGAPARVFEYYLDAILFKSLLPPLAEVIQQDVRFYRAAGVHTVQALMTGNSPWLAPQLNVWLFPRLLWDSEQDLDTLIASFSQAAYGVDLRRYYRLLEQAFRNALDIVPEQVKLTVAHGIHQLWETPPADMGDPVFAPLEILEEKNRQKRDIPALLQQAGRLLAEAVDLDPRATLEQQQFELIRFWLEYDFWRSRLYAALKSGDIQQAKTEWAQSMKALQGIYDWGDRHIQAPQYRLNFHFIQFYTWQIRLNKINAEHFKNRVGRCWVMYGTKWRLTRFYRKLRHLYSVKNQLNRT